MLHQSDPLWILESKPLESLMSILQQNRNALTFKTNYQIKLVTPDWRSSTYQNGRGGVIGSPRVEDTQQNVHEAVKTYIKKTAQRNLVKQYLQKGSHRFKSVLLIRFTKCCYQCLNSDVGCYLILNIFYE